MSLIISKIQKAKTDNKIICICINTIKWNNRLIGYVKEIYSNNKFNLKVIDEFGQNKIIRTVLFSTIKSLEIGGSYNDNLEKLNKNGFVKSKTKTKYFLSWQQNLYTKLCELKNLKTLCTFFFKEEFSIGVVIGISNQELSIKNITFDGRSDGTSVYDVTALTKIRIGSAIENKITFLKKKKIY